MKIAFLEPAAPAGDAIVVAVAEDKALSPSAEALDQATGGAVRKAIAASRFTGKARQFLDIVAPNGVNAGRIVLAGLGQLLAQVFEALL